MNAGLLGLGLQLVVWLNHRFFTPLQRVLEAPGWAPYLGGELGSSTVHLALACWRKAPCWQQYQQQLLPWQPQEIWLAWPLALVALGLLWPDPPLARKSPGSARWSATRDVQHLLYRQLPPKKS